jgi:hypothetical protein
MAMLSLLRLPAEDRFRLVATFGLKEGFAQDGINVGDGSHTTIQSPARRSGPTAPDRVRGAAREPGTSKER